MLTKEERDALLAKPGRRTPREKALITPKSASLAIAAFCYHDCHHQEDRNSHTTKLAIKECLKTTCALWLKRPFQKITGGNCKPNKAPD